MRHVVGRALHVLSVSGVVEQSTHLLRQVVRRVVARGDVRPGAIGEMAFDVTPAMMMYRSKVCGSEWQDVGIAGATDRVVMPLLCPRDG